MYYVHPSEVELYSLRLLLTHICGATSYEFLRTINNVVYETFQDACRAAGFLDDDNEWIDAIKDAASWSTSHQLRKLFVYILEYSQPTNPMHIWNNIWHLLGDDINYLFKNTLNNESYEVPENVKKDYILECLEKDLVQLGTSLSSFGLPLPNTVFLNQISNRLIREQMSFNRPGLISESINMRAQLNSDQLQVHDAVIAYVEAEDGHFFFVNGHGGTGKTFLWQSIIASVRSQGKIVLPVASSGLAALLLEGGTTAHSRFKIPVDVADMKTCDIKQGTHLAELIQHTSLIVWDEAPMNHKSCFEALDITLRDIMGLVSNERMYKIFGGITVVLGGDFRQTLPIIAGGSRYDSVSSCITNSYLWSHCRMFELKINMRLLHAHMNSKEREEAEQFASWLLAVGNGTVKGKKFYGSSEADWIKMPSEILLPVTAEPCTSIISATYTDIKSNYQNIQYLHYRAIVTPTNQDADTINSIITDMIPGKPFVYLSSDSIQEKETVAEELRDMYPVDYLHLLSPNGVPNHEISLKNGVPIMLLRNIDPSAGLCNGTRLLVTRLGLHSIEAEIITAHARGTKTLIRRIIFLKTENRWPFTLRRKQFPIRICYAMTINKSQGQTLPTIGIYLPRPVFSHGQLYVALSRAKYKMGIKMLIINPDDRHSNYTQNIVYKEVFDY